MALNHFKICKAILIKLLRICKSRSACLFKLMARAEISISFREPAVFKINYLLSSVKLKQQKLNTARSVEQRSRFCLFWIILLDFKRKITGEWAFKHLLLVTIDIKHNKVNINV